MGPLSVNVRRGSFFWGNVKKYGYDHREDMVGMVEMIRGLAKNGRLAGKMWGKGKIENSKLLEPL